MKGYDCATPMDATLAPLFAADGFTHICRYLVPDGWKRLTKDEADVITKAGIKIVSVYETTADRACGGASNGTEDGKAAMQCAKAIGQTLGTAIYFVVDCDAQASDMNAIESYLKAAALQIAGYEIGVYGSFAVVEEMFKRGAAKHFWQTVAWSHGNKSVHANIYQSEIDTTLHGIGVDYDDILGNEGGWDTLQIPVVDAAKIIGLISNAYMATSDPAARLEWHRLANSMRLASNQPTT